MKSILIPFILFLLLLQAEPYSEGLVKVVINANETGNLFDNDTFLARCKDTVMLLSSGTHRFEFKKEGYFTDEEDIDSINKVEIDTITFNLKKTRIIVNIGTLVTGKDNHNYWYLFGIGFKNQAIKVSGLIFINEGSNAPSFGTNIYYLPVNKKNLEFGFGAITENINFPAYYRFYFGPDLELSLGLNRAKLNSTVKLMMLPEVLIQAGLSFQMEF